VILLAVPASGEKGNSKDSQEKAAKKACALGDFQKGADILIDLFVETNDPTYVYNQGRCYQQNNRWEQAISRFREYLRKARDLSDDERAETERQIDDCESSLNKAPRIEPPTPPVPPVPHSDSRSALPEPVKQEKATALSDDRLSKSLRTAGIICSVVGLVGFGTGVGLALKTQSISSDEQEHGPTLAKEDQRRTFESWGWVGYGAGAAAIAAGAVLYTIGWARAPSDRVALRPILAPGSASVMLKESF
jgi:tetratricopeptide (TPR) repeat protein